MERNKSKREQIVHRMMQIAFDGASSVIQPTAVYDDESSTYQRFMYQDVLAASNKAQQLWRQQVQENFAVNAPPLDLALIVGGAFMYRDSEEDVDVEDAIAAGRHVCNFARVFATIMLQGTVYRMVNDGVMGGVESSLGNDAALFSDLDDLEQVSEIYFEQT